MVLKKNLYKYKFIIPQFLYHSASLWKSKSLAIEFPSSLNRRGICLFVTNSTVCARIRSTGPRNSVEPSTPRPPPLVISRVISSSNTIALESHCSTSILQTSQIPVPQPVSTANTQSPRLFRNRIRDRDDVETRSFLPSSYIVSNVEIHRPRCTLPSINHRILTYFLWIYNS